MTCVLAILGGFAIGCGFALMNLASKANMVPLHDGLIAFSLGLALAGGGAGALYNALQ